MYIYSDIFAWLVVVVTSFFIRPTESNAERDKLLKHHTSNNIAKPLVISLKNHSNFCLHQSTNKKYHTRFTFPIQSYFIIHEFNHVNTDRHELLLRGLSLYITHINTTWSDVRNVFSVIFWSLFQWNLMPIQHRKYRENSCSTINSAGWGVFDSRRAYCHNQANRQTNNGQYH
jgi:hypothetical protein